VTIKKIKTLQKQGEVDRLFSHHVKSFEAGAQRNTSDFTPTSQADNDGANGKLLDYINENGCRTLPQKGTYGE
jgi:hypothetical protein